MYFCIQNHLALLIMAFFSYNKLWESEFDNIVFEKDKVHDINFNQLKLKVIEAYEKDEKITTDFEPIDDSDVMNKLYPEEKSSEIDTHLSLIKKDYNEIKILNAKQSVEEVLIQRAVKTNIQIFYDKGMFDAFPNAHSVLRSFVFRKALTWFRACEWYRLRIFFINTI